MQEIAGRLEVLAEATPDDEDEAAGCWCRSTGRGTRRARHSNPVRADEGPQVLLSAAFGRSERVQRVRQDAPLPARRVTQLILADPS